MTREVIDGAVRMPGRWQSIFWQCIAGFVLGFAVLHPASMVVFHWLDPRISAGVPHEPADNWLAPIVHSFQLSMLPMGLVFATIGAAIATAYGYHQMTVVTQRNRLLAAITRNEQLREGLAEQAETLKSNNEELARLELANRRSTQFMAHDFKNALGCIAGFSNRLLDRPEVQTDNDATDALICIRRQAHRMLGNVTDLLEFARTREGGDPRCQPVSVADVLLEVVSDFSLPAHEERVLLGEDHLHCPSVLADRRLLRRVLCNLVSNAIEHNGPSTRVWLDGQHDHEHGVVLFTCRDNGVGIDADIRPLIFRPFASSGDLHGQCTGLGLAFCKAVVEAHHGQVWCESEPGRGACFSFTIPTIKEPNDERSCPVSTTHLDRR